jgi:hypothetical protein
VKQPSPVVKREALLAAMSLAWGCVVAVAAYAIVRGIQFFLYPDPNPATLVWSAHAGYFWRAWTCGYAGGIAVFVAYLLARAHTDATARALAPAAGVAALLLALQTLAFP